MDVSVVIVNWNSADYVHACIQSLHEQTSGMAYEVIVVDNASFDGCGERLAAEFPGVVFVQSQSNLGFGRANNLGAKHARGKVLLFLNPDTDIKDRAIDRLYEQFCRLDHPGAVGCRLLNSDGSLQKSCVQALPTVLNQILDADVLQRWFPRSGFWGGAALYEGTMEAVEVEAVSGACLMMRKDVFECVGGFSPEFFMYGEDIDLCFKARRAGLRNYHVGQAVIVHHGGGSSDRAISNFSNVLVRESMSRFLRKSRGPLYSSCYRAAMCGMAVIRMVLLGVLFPVWFARRGVRRWRAVFRKWWGVLRWGLGFEQWTRQYDRLEPVSVRPMDGAAKSCPGPAGN